jgi:hypothetical protein
MNDTLNPQDIQKHFDSALDSVNLLNSGKPENITDVDWADIVQRNVEHLKVMVVKDFWQGQDLTPLKEAIKRQGG